MILIRLLCIAIIAMVLKDTNASVIQCLWVIGAIVVRDFAIYLEINGGN